MELSRVVVTGGAGFLGSHTVRRLLEEGHQVSIADDLSSGSVRNLKGLGVDLDCDVGDLKDYDFAKRSLANADSVFHFAAEVGSVAYLHGSKERELAALQANMAIDVNVFRACIENRVERVIYASSVSVYPFDEQAGSEIRFKEEDSERKVNPEGGYGWSKYMGEKQLEMMPGVASGVARIFHAYGENIYLDPDRSQVIASLIRKAVRYPEEDFVVWGDGSQRRCFVYIDDAMDAIFRLYHHIGRNGSLTVNIGSTEEVTVREIAHRAVALSGKDIPMKFDETKPTGALSRTPDLERAKKVLGWSPTTGFSEGLEKTFAWAKRRLSGPRGA
jgi:nucleoside-diphosphate-sugar epimerase